MRDEVRGRENQNFEMMKRERGKRKREVRGNFERKRGGSAEERKEREDARRL